MSSKHAFSRSGRFVAAAAVAALVCTAPGATVRATGVPALPASVTYLLPILGSYQSLSPSEFAAAAADLRVRLAPNGEGPLARIGFSSYVFISMDDWAVDTTDPAAIRAALAGTISQIDTAVTRAVENNIPLCLSFLTAIRYRYDPAQAASEREDRRNMQWYTDNTIAPGWWTHSQYARKQRRVQEAYIRELGKVVAGYMAQYPSTLVAATGDGEVELSFERWTTLTQPAPSWADYSPFAVAEFRDWLRGGGLYADGGPLAGQGYTQRARYATDASPADPGADGHSLNGDMGTSFTTWNLSYFDWSLADDPNADPHAIPESQSTQIEGKAGGFDAPRVRQPGKPWWEAWIRFRQEMIQRHNRDFARWMTTSADSATGATIPSERWYSDQVPADYLFGYPPPDTGLRLLTSASPWWTADVTPYGCAGITAYNVNQDGVHFARTLVNVAPVISSRTPCWGITEWNPSDPWTADPAIYREDMALVERYHPRLLIPFMWDEPTHWVVSNAGFETALRELVAQIGRPHLDVDRWSLRFGIVRNSASGGAQELGLTQVGAGALDWTAAGDRSWLKVSPASGSGTGRVSVTIDPTDAGLQATGSFTGHVVLSSPVMAHPVTVDVVVTVSASGATTAPFGQIDTPAQNATGVVGSIGVTGWALDDVGVSTIRLYRNCLAFEEPAYPGASTPCQTLDDHRVVYMGKATFVSGSRPDVEAVFPSHPQAYRAGWAYLLQSNLLPHVPKGQPYGGQGTLQLYAFATDAEGHRTLLGRNRLDHTPTTFTLSNDTIAKPFGAIDTPGQGETLTGWVANFGWALTPDTNLASGDADDIVIPRNGSTMTVWVDGVALGQVEYNGCRGSAAVGSPVTVGLYCDDDVANIFGNPAPKPTFTTRTANLTKYRNLDVESGGIGHFGLDTRTLSNGLHTIAWGVVDSAGRAEGIGSRYFNVLNGIAAAGLAAAPSGPDAASLLAAPPAAKGDARTLEGLVMDVGDVQVRTGFDPGAPFEALPAGDDGVHRVRLGEFDRLELRLGPVDAGYLVANGALRELPPGSHLDPATGRFTWMPGIGFLGTYDLSFVRGGAHLGVSVAIRPIRPARPGEAEIRMWLDLPRTGESLPGEFVVAGWALDPQASHGSGIGAIHVWARRQDVPGARPFFLGEAALGGDRPDVARVHGAQFGRVGFSLTTPDLRPGTYEVTAFAWSRRTARWENARTVSVIVR